ncbi:MAG: hypothetical protein EON95_18185 [Caulobacteraceae bacterium]|nr:MAG: hypothetical protein EON95_18185 [Caulobacteraceae bacterium]
MTPEDRIKIEQGQLALALVMMDFERRVARKEAGEQELAELTAAALERFPPDFQAALRAEIAARSPA